jgi:hypothetical protein
MTRGILVLVERFLRLESLPALVTLAARIASIILVLLERSRRIESRVFPSSMYVCYLKYLPRIVPWQVFTSPSLSRLQLNYISNYSLCVLILPCVR